MYGNTRWALVLAACLLLPACTIFYPKDLQKIAVPINKANLTPAPPSREDLDGLPLPRGEIVAAVYGFRDMTGQYKASPDSPYSTVVSQGGTAMLMKALMESRWFLPVEREGLQNLLTERRIVRGVNEGNPNAGPPQLPNLLPASIIIEGGIVAYDSNVRTGGAGVNYYGFGINDQYQTDQVTVTLRAIDVRTGRVIATVTTTKTVYSSKLQSDLYRYVAFKRLLQVEAGYTRNEPVQLCLQDAVESAVAHLVALGIRQNLWSLRDPGDANNVVLKDMWIELGLDKPAAGQPIADISKLPTEKKPATRPTAPPPAPAPPPPAATNASQTPSSATPSARDAGAAQMPSNNEPQPMAPKAPLDLGN